MGSPPDSEEILTSLAQFDVLASLVTVNEHHSADSRVLYPSFARYRQARAQPLIERLIHDSDMRTALGFLEDEQLALSLGWVGFLAGKLGDQYLSGFEGWGRVMFAFISEHWPDSEPNPGEDR